MKTTALLFVLVVAGVTVTAGPAPAGSGTTTNIQ